MIHMRSFSEKESTYSLSSHMMTVARMTYKIFTIAMRVAVTQPPGFHHRPITLMMSNSCKSPTRTFLWVALEVPQKVRLGLDNFAQLYIFDGFSHSCSDFQVRVGDRNHSTGVPRQIRHPGGVSNGWRGSPNPDFGCRHHQISLRFLGAGCRITKSFGFFISGCRIPKIFRDSNPRPRIQMTRT